MYTPRMKPRAHQDKGRALSRGKRLFAYLCEMGTGKTKMILDEWGERVEEGKIHDLLVLAPAGSYRNWDRDKNLDDLESSPSELRKHLSPDLFSRVSSCAWVSGQGVTARKRLALFLALRSKPRVLVVNLEALSSTEEEAFKVCWEFLTAPGRKVMMVIDESTGIRNDRAARTKAVMRLSGQADLRRIMTGLIAPRSPVDLFAQFEFLDWRILGFRSLFAFQNRYCVMEKSRTYIGLDKKGEPKFRNFRIVVGYKNVEELQKKIAPYSYRVLKSECLDLPPKIYQTREVELTPEQKRIYNELVLFSTAELENKAHVTTNMVITKLLRLHQLVCGHTVDEQGDEHDVPSNRIQEMMELLEEHNGKVIIWTGYRREVAKIVKALEKEYGEGSVAQFHGGNKNMRGNDEAKFLSDPQCRFMVSTQSAGGRGNTWVNANLVIYFSNNYDLEMRLQSEDRSHRDGLKHAVTYVDLVAPNSIDEKIIKTLRKKLDMATLISGENYREWLI